MTHAPVPKLIPIFVLLLSGIGLLTALLGTGTAATAISSPIWGMLGFEIVAVAAFVVGILAGLRKFGSSYAMALLCVGGTVLIAAGLAFLDARPNLADAPEAARLLVPITALRVAIGGAIVALAAMTRLAQQPGAFQSLVLGIVLLVPGPIIAALIWKGIIPIPEEGGTAIAEVIKLTVGTLVVLILGALFAFGGDLVIRAFTNPEEPAKPA